LQDDEIDKKNKRIAELELDKKLLITQIANNSKLHQFEIKDIELRLQDVNENISKLQNEIYFIQSDFEIKESKYKIKISELVQINETYKYEITLLAQKIREFETSLHFDFDFTNSPFYKKSNSFLLNGELNKAIEIFNDPDYLNWKKNITNKIEQEHKLIDIKFNKPLAYDELLIAKIYYIKLEYQKAEEHFNNSINLFKFDLNVKQYAKFLKERNEFKKAIPYFLDLEQFFINNQITEIKFNIDNFDQLKLDLSENIPFDLITCQAFIADIYNQLQDYQQREKYLLKTLNVVDIQELSITALYSAITNLLLLYNFNKQYYHTEHFLNILHSIIIHNKLEEKLLNNIEFDLVFFLTIQFLFDFYVIASEYYYFKFDDDNYQKTVIKAKLIYSKTVEYIDNNYTHFNSIEPCEQYKNRIFAVSIHNLNNTPELYREMKDLELYSIDKVFFETKNFDFHFLILLNIKFERVISNNILFAAGNIEDDKIDKFSENTINEFSLKS